MSSNNFKCGFVTIAGRPNAGKSTLINSLVGQKISIVSSIPQTTRYAVRGILTRINYQIVFVDTPGMHIFRHRLALKLNNISRDSLAYCDIILYVADLSRFPVKEEETVLDIISRLKIPVVAVLNKIDKSKDYLNVYLDLIKRYDSGRDIFKYFIPASALKGINLDKIEKSLEEFLPFNPPFYEEDVLTDFSREFRIADIVREGFYRHIKEELPHSMAVKTEEIVDRGKVVYVLCSVIVETQAQKKIIIGRGGRLIKEAGIYSRAEIEKILGKKTYLDLRAKVLKDWQVNFRFLRELGYV